MVLKFYENRERGLNIKIPGFGVVDDDGAGGLLGDELVTLREGDADPLGF